MRFLYVAFIFVMFIFSSCGDSNEPHQEFEEYLDEGKKDAIDQVKNIFYMIPSPMETAIVLKKAGAIYENSLLNDPERAMKYDTKIKKAVNLGIYGADLSYATLFDQTQETMFYVSSAKKIAESLGVMKAFDDATLQRIEDNVENKDSMMHIVSEVYWIADSYLKENESISLSTLIIFGGWIEASYIASNIYSKNKTNEEMKNRILEQKYSLDNLYILSTAKDNETELSDLSLDLKKIKDIFDQMKTEEVAVTTNTRDKINIIEGKSKIMASDSQMEQLVKQIIQIREKYTSV